MTTLDEKLFKDVTAWTRWLEKEHANCPGIWMRIAKKSAGEPSVQYPEALDVALCFGWIDGQKKSIDENYWLQKWTPRAARSIWSKINREKVQALIDKGLMREPGMREIERAKADGRWEQAYDSWSAATVPGDLQAALDASPKAKKFFATLNSHNRYAILFRTHSAKRAETRAKRIAEFVAMLERGETIYPQA
ncbi:YdeI/OmpD-associated family protein [Pseudoduganella sp. RAF53_2]|uniref:YdeI/OmpD-associated family protein n=1 Tax=unclassified Pseudoduganella TaxID=2637179 RepID=UPI003F9874F7